MIRRRHNWQRARARTIKTTKNVAASSFAERRRVLVIHEFYIKKWKILFLCIGVKISWKKLHVHIRHRATNTAILYAAQTIAWINMWFRFLFVSMCAWCVLIRRTRYVRRTYKRTRKKINNIQTLNRKTVALRLMCARLFVMLMNLKQSSPSMWAAMLRTHFVFFFFWNRWWVMRPSPPPSPSLGIVTFSLFTLEQTMPLHCGSSAGSKPNLYILRCAESFLFINGCFFQRDPAADETMIFFFCSRDRETPNRTEIHIILLLMGILKFIIFICVVVYLESNEPQAFICDVGFFGCFSVFTWTHWL